MKREYRKHQMERWSVGAWSARLIRGWVSCRMLISCIKAFRACIAAGPELY